MDSGWLMLIYVLCNAVRYFYSSWWSAFVRIGYVILFYKQAKLCICCHFCKCGQRCFTVTVVWRAIQMFHHLCGALDDMAEHSVCCSDIITFPRFASWRNPVAVFKLSARLRTLTGKIWVGPVSFPSLSYINFGKIMYACFGLASFRFYFEDCCRVDALMAPRPLSIQW